MSKLKAIIIALIILTTVILLLLIKYNYSAKGIHILIINKSDNSITNLNFNFTGGNHQITLLKSNQSVEFNIDPTGESGLDLSFIDAAGHKRSRSIDVYFETGYKGVLYIQVDHNGDVNWQNKITI